MQYRCPSCFIRWKDTHISDSEHAQLCRFCARCPTAKELMKHQVASFQFMSNEDRWAALKFILEHVIGLTDAKGP